MLFTVDRLQIVNGRLIAFEFFNFETEHTLTNFNIQKKSFVKNADFCDKYYGIGYTVNLISFIVIEYDFLKDTNREYNFDWKQYQSWFTQINGLGFTKGSVSKPLSSSTKNVGDPYVQGLLNAIHINQYPKIDFSCDDSGLALTIQALNGRSTTGFDFDIYEPTEKIAIEFLKRENKYVSNLTAHPVRYPWNYQKFISLWNATRHLDGTLYLVNYSDDYNEAISVIEVTEINKNTGFIESDIGYKMTNYNDLLDWLKLLNINVSAARKYLYNKPTEKRNRNFWENYQREEVLVKNKKKDYNQLKGKIGKQYL